MNFAMLSDRWLVTKFGGVMNFNEISPWNWFKDDKASKREKKQLDRNPLVALQREVDSIFDRFFENFDMSSPFPEKESRSSNAAHLYPKMDISETDKSYKVSIELPGVERKDIQISVTNNRLTVRGNKSHQQEESKENFHKIERVYGSFERIISLPDNVSEDNIIAELRDGVLCIELGKKKITQASIKKIDIK
jgi:HSP20 family protein